VTQPIAAVLWDIGQVVYPSPFERFDEFEQLVGLPPGSLPRGPFSVDADPAYAEVETGLRDEASYWRDVEAAARDNVPDLQFHSQLRSLGWRGHERPDVVTLLAEIHADHRQGVLTNDATAFLGAGWREDWVLADHFDAIVDSLDIGVRKPAAEAYQRGVEALGCAAAEVLFIDDLTVNVEAARQAGLQAVRFDTTDVPSSVTAVRHALATG
jgi:putative hydrolase of the HAD superfamily